MFSKIRLRLALIYFVIFFCILISLSAILYAHMRFKLFHQVDITLQAMEERVQHRSFEDLLHSLHPEPESDRLTLYLFWDAQGNLIGQVPNQSIKLQEAHHFKGDPVKRQFWTINADGKHYRALMIPNPTRSPDSDSSPASSSIAAIELVRTLDPEEGMLRSLLLDILIGAVVGGIIIIVAGFYLAGRALIPIRRSWDKQQRFVADASHELRTPTSVIQTQTELLFRHPAHTIEQESDNIALILKESKRMGKLVDDLLTLARTDSNQLQIRVSHLQLDQLLEELANQFRYLSDTQQVCLITDIQSPLPFSGDEERIRQLLVILLDNALKFTPPEGTIELSCHVQGHHIHLSVKDSGLGIPADEIALIFERFYRGDKARSRAEGGTGLGLSIAKWIVEAHGGEIRVQSQLGSGTDMLVIFPLSKHPIAANPN